MAYPLFIEFDQPVLIENWQAICDNSGIAYAPKVAGFSSYFLADQVEIVLGHPGRWVDGKPTPPDSFQTLTISALTDVRENIAGCVMLARKILKRHSGKIVKYSEPFTQHFEAEGLEASEDSRILWGTKPISNEAMSNVNNRRLLMDIQNGVYSAVQDELYKKADATAESIKETLTKHMNSAVQSAAIHKGGVDSVKRVYVGWKDIYPSPVKRFLAWFAFKVLRRSSKIMRRPGPFLRMLGYRSQQRVHYVFDTVEELVANQKSNEVVDTYDTACDFLNALIERNGIVAEDIAILEVPYSYVAAEISFMPVAPARYIKANITISKSDLDGEDE